MGECDRGNICTKPLYSCGFLQNPVVQNNAAWDGAKSMEKQRFSTVFLGFAPIFAYFALILLVFGRN